METIPNSGNELDSKSGLLLIFKITTPPNSLTCVFGTPCIFFGKKERILLFEPFNNTKTPLKKKSQNLQLFDVTSADVLQITNKFLQDQLYFTKVASDLKY